MPRKKCKRNINCTPDAHLYKPMAIPMSKLETIHLSIDEFEAIRLADKEGLYQEQAAEQMMISRQTFGRILTEAHRKIAEALVETKAIKIENKEQ